LALLNALRGSGRLHRWAFWLLAGLATLLATGSWLAALAVTAGLVLWLAAGWHFDAADGRFSLLPPRVRWINAVCLRLLPHADSDTPARNKLRGTLWMGLRGLYFYPAFAVLALSNPWAAAWGLGVLLQGPAYYLGGRLAPPRPAVRLAEALTGLLFGALVALATPN